jgi:hypothetical protein
MTVTGRFPARADEAMALCRCLYFDGALSPREVMVPEQALEEATVNRQERQGP